MGRKLKLGHLGGNVIGGDPNTYYPDLWKFLISEYKVKSVLDIGCGEGYSLNFFKENGVFTFGIDGAESNIFKCLSMGHSGSIIDLSKQSFCSPFLFDLGWCCEVVEHVEEKFVLNIINSFKNCKILCMTHALPNQGGYHHVNCKNWDYWVDLMHSNGFQLLKNESKKSRKFYPKSYWGKTGLIFKNKNI